LRLFVLKSSRIPRENFFIDYPFIPRNCITFISEYDDIARIQAYNGSNVYMEYETNGIDFKTRDAFKHIVKRRNMAEFKPEPWLNFLEEIIARLRRL
jgi:hypothetical protein